MRIPEPINRRQRLRLCEVDGAPMRVNGTCPACANREMFSAAQSALNENAAKAERAKRGGRSTPFIFGGNTGTDRFARGRR